MRAGVTGRGTSARRSAAVLSITPDINRAVPLGALVRTESGQTRGNEYTARLLGGIGFNWQNVLHGPWARVAYTRATVKQYAERGSGTDRIDLRRTTAHVAVVESWLAGAGARSECSGRSAAWRGSTNRATTTASVSASSVTLGGHYSIPVAKPDNNYAMFNLGTSADFGRITGFVYGTATAARSDSNYWAITVGIRAPL
jgi:uncharacterized protein YhjY with autotransporter beta-barrel domain